MSPETSGNPEGEIKIGPRDYIGEGNRLVKANNLKYEIGDITILYDAVYANGTPAIIKVLKPKDYLFTTADNITTKIDRPAAQQLLTNEYDSLKKLADADITHIPIPAHLHILGQDEDTKTAPYLTMSKPNGETLDKTEALDEESALAASRQFIQTINQAITEGVLYNNPANLNALVWDSINRTLTITDWQNAVPVEEQALVLQAVNVLQVITLLCQKFSTDPTTIQTSELKNFLVLQDKLRQGSLQMEANQILQVIQRILSGEQLDVAITAAKTGVEIITPQTLPPVGTEPATVQPQPTPDVTPLPPLVSSTLEAAALPADDEPVAVLTPVLDPTHELAAPTVQTERVLTPDQQKNFDRIKKLPKETFDRLLAFARANSATRPALANDQPVTTSPAPEDLNSPLPPYKDNQD